MNAIIIVLVLLLFFYLVDAVFFFFLLRRTIKKLNTKMCIYYSMVLALLWPWQVKKLYQLMQEIKSKN